MPRITQGMLNEAIANLWRQWNLRSPLATFGVSLMSASTGAIEEGGEAALYGLPTPQRLAPPPVPQSGERRMGPAEEPQPGCSGWDWVHFPLAVMEPWRPWDWDGEETPLPLPWNPNHRTWDKDGISHRHLLGADTDLLWGKRLTGDAPKAKRHWVGRRAAASRMASSALFHQQIATCIENVNFQEENVDLLPGTSSGK